MVSRRVTAARSCALAAATTFALLSLTPAARAADTTLNVTLQWTDRLGAIHPMKFQKVDFWEDNSQNLIFTADQFLGTSGTLANGIATLQTNYSDGLLDSTDEIYFRVHAKIPGVVRVVQKFGDADPYSTRVPPTGWFPATENAVNNLGPTAVDNTTFTGTASGIMAAVQYARSYWSLLGATQPGEIEVQYYDAFSDPNGAGDRGSYAIDNRMNVGYRSWANWDVILHEYGHIVAQYNRLDTRPALGLSHNLGEDMIGKNIVPIGGGMFRAATAAEGAQLAWQEGIATYLGLSSTKYGGLNSLIPGLPAADRDETYHNFLVDGTTVNFKVGIESRSDDGTVGQGEGDEVSTMRIVWDLADDDDNMNPLLGTGEFYQKHGGDRWDLGPKKVFDLLKDTDNPRLIDFWKKVRTNYANSPELKAKLGEVFEEYGVSASPLTAGDVVGPRFRLRWDEQNNDRSAFYEVLIYSLDWSTLIYDSGQLNNPAINPGAPGSVFWDVDQDIAEGMYNWVVLNSGVTQAAISLDDSYWSSALQIRVVPEPTTLTLLALATALTPTHRRRRR